MSTADDQSQNSGENEQIQPSYGDNNGEQQRRQGGRTKGRVSIACTICRDQHLRCDAAVPCCSRCRSLNKTCVYTDIRRRRRKRISEESTRTRAVCDDGGLDLDARHVDPGITEPQQAQTDLSSFLPLGGNDFYPLLAGDSDGLQSSRAFDGFYTFFFEAHPFVLPRAELIQQFETDADSVSELLLAITFIGSRYIRERPSDGISRGAEQMLDKGLVPTGFSVQVLMLLALCLEWSGESKKASNSLQRAKTTALAIGLNRRSFAATHGRGNPVLEESWRRTWWELYVVDSLFAGIRHWPTFSLWGVESDVCLPGEEECYVTGNIHPPRTLGEYDDRCFEAGDDSFSSFTYLIDAARILGTTLAAGDIAGGSPDSLVKNAEANIMSWDLYLPQSKRDPVRPDGTVDEVLFRARLMINTVAIHLHRPRSTLHYSTMELLCSKYAPPLPAEVLPVEERHHDRHTHKAIRAAKAFVDMLSVPSPPTMHSPFILCMGSMAVVTHLSACEYALAGSEFAHARDRVRVFLGILRAFEGVWGQAERWRRELTLMAKAVFEGRGQRGELVLGSSSGTAVTDELFVTGNVGDLGARLDGTMEGMVGDTGGRAFL
ncbi:uncharacterized protein DNG_00072 [Cephalotrichum gorgonifer]|uniref:Zn(2)-C6 fungal-type domain-containing protein n=1 Tax=Cephalotrichum gorgonifer TaxID=2041049 RepID=A0AAE8MNM5_9PEZI|nr:uncharacterized protein DNG_00072 [Cephalotrichum gorgonifer]